MSINNSPLYCEILSPFGVKNMITRINTLNWEKQKEKLKQKFGFLTDNKQIFDEGEKDELFKKLQKRLGITKEELHLIIAGL